MLRLSTLRNTAGPILGALALSSLAVRLYKQYCNSTNTTTTTKTNTNSVTHSNINSNTNTNDSEELTDPTEWLDSNAFTLESSLTETPSCASPLSHTFTLSPLLAMAEKASQLDTKQSNYFLPLNEFMTDEDLSRQALVETRVALTLPSPLSMTHYDVSFVSPLASPTLVTPKVMNAPTLRLLERVSILSTLEEEDESEWMHPLIVTSQTSMDTIDIPTESALNKSNQEDMTVL